MEESGQRAPYPEVIDEKGLKSKKRVFLETLITLGFWGIILHLLAIFVTFILWYFGFQLAFYEFYVVGFFEMQRLFANALIVTFIVVILTLVWSWYNILLIKIKGERRGSQVSICFDQDMAKLFHMDSDVLDKMKNSPRISVLFSQDDIIFTATDLPASQAT